MVFDPNPPPALVQNLATRDQGAPVDPLTGEPRLCLAHGDIVESVVFILEYRRRHPGEKAALVLPAIRRPRQALLPVAAFTQGGGLYLHTPLWGDLRLENRRPADIAKIPELFADYAALLRVYAQAHGFRTAADLEAAPRRWPEALPGDSEARQLQRALARLQRAGVSSKIVDQGSAGGSRLILEYNGLQFGWSPRHRLSYYNGLGDPPAQNSVIEGILFVCRYRQAHPAERAFAYIDALPGASTAGRMVATAVYTRDGRVYSHHLLTGDLASPLTPADLGDAEKVIGVTRQIYQARRAMQRAERRVLPPTADAGFDQSELQPEVVNERLRASGIPSRLVPAGAGEPGDSGRTAVRFEWDGAAYTYTAEMGCFRATPP